MATEEPKETEALAEGAEAPQEVKPQEPLEKFSLPGKSISPLLMRGFQQLMTLQIASCTECFLTPPGSLFRCHGWCKS
eukprot:264652-Rhodomonas_salina.3